MLVGAQMLFVAFGALVLVPLLTGLDPNVALFTAGAGTLVFHVVTGFRVPVFLASSFAFIAPITYGVVEFGVSGMLSGLVAAGLVYVGLAALVRWRGQAIVHRVLPPVVTGPVIMVIGLALAPVAIDMATGMAVGDYSGRAIAVALVALVATIATAMFARGMVDLTPVRDAAWLAMPAFVLPTFSLPAIEHVGDGLATSLAGFLGGPPNTTYSEVTGAVALTKAFQPIVMVIAAVFAIVLAFVGKLGAVLQTIPTPVMGGILVIMAVILAFGVGGMAFHLGEFTVEGIGLAGIVGVVLNLVLPRTAPDEARA